MQRILQNSRLNIKLNFPSFIISSFIAISSEIHFQLSTLLVINKFHVSKSDRDIMGFVWSSNFALDLGSEILNLATLFSVSKWKKHSERR